MGKKLANLGFLVVLSLIFTQCANKGTASGGPKDELPPVIIKSIPENFSLNFDSKEITIYFDEYIKMKDLQKQLIISPLMDPEPEITPVGSASKYIKIKILDTLRQNTTYALILEKVLRITMKGIYSRIINMCFLQVVILILFLFLELLPMP